MTMIDLDTSPLQAAREWRGINLVAAARSAGLHVGQAEALEEGDLAAFESIDEMIAAAVVYGATIGIGRDEAMALLDRTVCGTGARVTLPDLDAGDDHSDEAPAREFTSAVRSRSARMAGGATSMPLVTPITDEELAGIHAGADGLGADLELHPVLDPITERPLEGPVEGPTPEQAIEASREIHIDTTAFGPTDEWDRDATGEWDTRGGTGELEAWAAEDYGRDGASFGGAAAVARPQRSEDGVWARVAATCHGALERVLGTERADAAADWTARAGERMQELTRDGRERLRRSEHATLIVAIGGGAVLIALLVAIGGALGGGEDGASSTPDASSGTAGPVVASPAEPEVPVATEEPVATEAKDPAPAAPAATPDAKPEPLLTPARMTVDVYNDGRTKGMAKEVAATLQTAGYGVGDVGNAPGDFPAAVVIYPAGKEREARILATAAGIETVQEATGTSRRFTLVLK